MTYRLAMKTTYSETPKGKRSIKTNIYGNIVGYVSGKRFWEFGANGESNKCDAELWAKGYSLQEIHDGVAHEKEGII